MAQDSGSTKLKSPSSSSSSTSSSSHEEKTDTSLPSSSSSLSLADDDRTDPNIVLPTPQSDQPSIIEVPDLQTLLRITNRATESASPSSSNTQKSSTASGSTSSTNSRTPQAAPPASSGSRTNLGARSGNRTNSAGNLSVLAPQGGSQSILKMPDLGPLNPLMQDPNVTEIMVNDIRNVMIEKEGKLIFSGLTVQTLDELNRITRNILDMTGKMLSPESPYLDTMLPDGSRVNIVIPPITLVGPCITIRKFPTKTLSIHDFIRSEAVDQRLAYFLNACVIGRLNILVCGGTGSGKTTLLNILTSLIPKQERLVTVEDTPELAIQHINSVRLQTKSQTPMSPAVTSRDLVANALRMRPDRIIVGECRRGEAFDMLQAMNTGHTGSMTTLHANSPRDALARLETLCMMSGVELPILAIRKQMASALDLIVQIHRFRSGKRRVTMVSEVTGMEGEVITLQDIFTFEIDLKTAGTTDLGKFKATGFVPTFIDRLRQNGIELPRDYFG